MALSKLQKLGFGGQIWHGGLNQLQAIEEQSLDLCIVMGVFQYLPAAEYRQTLRCLHDVLKPGGSLACTFQNALLDLFTFNKYTVDFFENQLFSELAGFGLDVPKAVAGIRQLIVNPDRPSSDETRARDNIFVRLSNPLTVYRELGEFGFWIPDHLYFYTLHPIPPLIREGHRTSQEGGLGNRSRVVSSSAVLASRANSSSNSKKLLLVHLDVPP